MRTFLWIVLGLSVAMLVRSLARWQAYRRRGENVPWYYAGNGAGAASSACLMASLLVEGDAWQWVLLTLALVFMAADGVLYARALRAKG